eukprot:7673429-Alexandrium_andersonii.AAC.1
MGSEQACKPLPDKKLHMVTGSAHGTPEPANIYGSASPRALVGSPPSPRQGKILRWRRQVTVSYTHLRAHETSAHL